MEESETTRDGHDPKNISEVSGETFFFWHCYITIAHPFHFLEQTKPNRRLKTSTDVI